MELSIYARAKQNVQDLKERLIELCLQNKFGGWSYKNFSIEEEAIFKTIEGEDKYRIIAFIIEENDNSLTLTPAKVKGEKGLLFKQFINCFGDIVNLLIENAWDSIEAIWIHNKYEDYNT